MSKTSSNGLSLTERLEYLSTAARRLLRAYGLGEAEAHLIEDKKNATFRVEHAPSGQRCFLRLSQPDDFSAAALRSELVWLKTLGDGGIVVAAPLTGQDGELLRPIRIEGLDEERWGALFRWLPGRQLDGDRLTAVDSARMGELLGRLHRAAVVFDPPAGFERPQRDAEQWFGNGRVIPAGYGEPLISDHHRDILDEAAERIRERLSTLGKDPEIYGLTHTDLEPDNVLDDDESLYPIDFTDCGWSYFLYDVAASLLPVAGRRDFSELRKAFIAGYERVRPLGAGAEELGVFLTARILFSMRLIVTEYWDDPRRRNYAEKLFPIMLGEVRRFLGARSGGGGASTTVELLDHLRKLDVRLTAEDGRLKLSAPKGALDTELKEELRSRKGEILEFLTKAKSQVDSRRLQRIPTVPRDAPLPLSFAQNRLWLIQQLDPKNGAYNVYTVVRMRGRLDRRALLGSMDALVRRHESLRTTFSTTADAEPYQVILPPASPRLPEVDLRGLRDACREAEHRRLAAREVQAPFNLERGPVLRLVLLRLAAEEHVLVVTMHHIISDGWSIGVMIRELSLCYSALARGEPIPLLTLDIQYADFACWQRRHLAAEVFEEQLAYWKKQLSGVPELLELPTDRPRGPVRGNRGDSRIRFLSRRLTDDLLLLGQRSESTLFMILLAALQAQLGRHAGQDDVVVGSPVANRNHAQLEGLIGFFVNTLVLRGDLRGDPSFLELLGRIRRSTLEAYDHQDLPFERLVEVLAPGRSMAHTPLFQVFFALQNTSAAELSMSGLELETVELVRKSSQFDLILTSVERPEGLRLALRFNPDLFDGSTVGRYLGQLEALLAAAARNPASRLSELMALPPAARHQLLYEWNDSPSYGPAGLLVPELVAAHAARCPNALAVSGLTAAGRRKDWTYGEFEELAERLARRLQGLGAEPERVVAVCLRRSPDWLLTLYAVLKTGGAYLPLDPAYPAERLRFLLDDADVRILVTEEALNSLFDGDYPRLVLERESEEPVEVEAKPWPTPHPENLAYVIYTSGSTGRPKGVEIRHHGLLQLVRWHQRAFGVGPSDRAVHVAGPAFDASVWEVWPYLAAGAAVLVPDDETRLSVSALRDEMLEQEVTIAFMPTPMAEIALAMPWPREAPLRCLLTGGDRLSRYPAAELPFQLVNNYGPTECTVVATSGPVSGGVEDLPPPSIGGPVDGVLLYVVDPRLRLRPLGAAGELCLGGGSLARGYRGRPAETAERFLPDPFSDRHGARLYRTGDLVRYRTDGRLHFLGRIDSQVKIHGVRIEIGEIEAVLVSGPGVAECVVVVRESPAGKSLAAYVAGDGSRPVPEALQEHLDRHLPDYMAPRVCVLDALPLTPNGKVDRRALPDPEEPAASGALRAEMNPDQEMVAGLMAEVLGLERVAPEGNFFELGGHSLLGTQLVARLGDVFQVELPLKTLFDAPTVAQLARAVRRLAADGEETQPIPAISDGSPAPLSFGQERMWFLDRLDPGTPTYNMPFALRMKGRVDVAALAAGFREVVRRHEVLRTTFELRDKEPVQIVHPPPREPLPEIDLQSLPQEIREEEARRIQNAAFRHRFDLLRGPLYLARLVRFDAEESRLFVNLHHSVGDGWSIAVLKRELVALYEAAIGGVSRSPLADLPVQYADYARWQRQWLDDPALVEREIGYWRQQLDGASELGDPLRGWPRPAVQTFHGDSLRQVLPAGLSAEVRALSRQTGTTLFMTLLAALSVLLHRLSGLPEILVGSPISGRDRPEIEGLIGMFLNTLVIRVDLREDKGFRGLLEQIRETSLAAYAHQRIPFERLLQVLHPRRDLSRTPFFQVFLNVLNLPDREVRLPDLRIEPLSSGGVAAKFDLTLYVEDASEGLRLNWVYNTDLFPEAQIAELAAQLEIFIAQAVSDPETNVRQFSLRTPAAEQVLPDPTAPPLPPVWNGAVHKRFLQRASEHPERPALIDGASVWTYGELSSRTRRLAAVLRQAGVERGDVVAIHACREVTLIWAMLGVLEAGGAFLVLDAAEPAVRRRACSESARPRAVLALEAAGELPADWTDAASGVFVLELPSNPETDWESEAPVEEPAAEPDPEDLAYLAFTSGTTGRPKGIRGSHRPLSHFLDWSGATFSFNAEDRFSMLSGLAHDPLLRDVFTPLVHGAALVVPPAGWRRDPEALAAWLAAAGITVTHLTPALGQLLLASDPSALETPLALRLACFGGDRLSTTSARSFAAWSGARVVNFYGATETPQAVAWDVVDAADEAMETAPIGRGIDGVDLLVINASGQPAGIGERGEIWVRTPYLALGYLDSDDPDERFAVNPLSGDPSDRVYRTGDFGGYLGDGRVLFLGRSDDQVSVRGFRVEPSEVAGILVRHPGVREAFAAGHADAAGDHRVVAWYVPSGEPPTPEELRRFVVEHLPAYMAPAALLPLAELPLNARGKVDRKALPDPADLAAPAVGVAPRDNLELAVAEVFAEVLDVDEVGVTDDFFDLGGHSLLTVVLLERLQERFGRRLQLSALFRASSVEKLALALKTTASSADEASPLVALRPSGSRAPFFCVHAIGGAVLAYRELVRCLSEEQPFYGLEARGESSALEEMAERYRGAIQKLKPQGPYRLGGWSMGGSVAFEIARQLEAAGEEVELLVLIDAFAPDLQERRRADESQLLAAFVRDLASSHGADAAELVEMAGEEGLDRVLVELEDRRLLPPSTGAAALRRRFKMFTGHRAAMERYLPEGVVDARTVIFEAAEKRSGPRPATGWRRWLQRAPAVVRLPGNHYSLLRSPQVEALASRLAKYLDAGG